MSERYSKVFSLPKDLYATGSPVIISAGALQKDNQSGKVFAQLKFQSISAQVIKAAKVSIQPLDTVGKPLGDSVQHAYLDLTAKRDSFFGQKTAISMPDSNTRAFTVTVDEVVYNDNSTWTANTEPWETLQSPQPLQSKLTVELAKQYRIEFGAFSKNLLCEQKDLWICSCGEINRADEATCHRCRKSLSALRSIDFTEMQKRCDERVAKEEQLKKEADEQAEKKRKKAVKIAAISAAIAIILGALALTKSVIIPSVKYNNAVKLMENGSYDEAVAAFEAMGDADMVTETKYQKAVSLMESGSYDEAVAAFEAMGDYKDSADMISETKYQNAVSLMESGNKVAAAIELYSIDFEDSKELWNEIAERPTVSVGLYHSVGLKADGTVVAIGYNLYGQCDVSDWTDIVAVSAGAYHSVGLKADGTVVAIGYNLYGQCDVSDWTDIVAVSAGYFHTVGLKADGTVIATGDNEHGQCDVSDWTNIVAVSAGGFHTVGLKADGTVVAIGANWHGQCDVSDWDDIVGISAGNSYVVGLKSNGTVVAIGDNEYGQCDVTNWTDIVAMSAGDFHSVGLKADGTVVATGANEYGQCDVSDWTDIVAVSAWGYHSVGLKADGTVVDTANNQYGQFDVSDWTNIKVPQQNNLE